jgi:hypothetical protein
MAKVHWHECKMVKSFLPPRFPSPQQPLKVINKFIVPAHRREDLFLTKE